jgi:hypothetical protein
MDLKDELAAARQYLESLKGGAATHKGDVDTTADEIRKVEAEIAALEAALDHDA